MKVELTPRPEPQEVDREASPEVLERLVKRGEIEVVTAASGTVLYIPQRLDE
jgi:hypothetical protein